MTVESEERFRPTPRCSRGYDGPGTETAFGASPEEGYQPAFRRRGTRGRVVSSRTATAAVGVAGSVLVSVLLWWYFDTFVFFLFLPFVPYLFRRSRRETATESLRVCPACDFRTTDDSYDYCPRDGTRLERPSEQ